MSLRIAAGRYKGQKITTVSGPGYRPAMDKVRQALFSMLESRGASWENIRVLDLFAGSGSLGLEALSRGAQEAVFVEQSPKAVRALQDTLTRLQIPKSQCRLVTKKVAGFLRQIPKQRFDLVFVDPPYGQNLLHSTLHTLQSGGWLAQSGLVAAEVEAEKDVENILGLEQEVNRTYGQTRIVIWRMKSQRPRSTLEPLIP
ncbi:MAG: 16S rRNA (guanine(966)-N(2))-methyltransferase RsmD [Desulfovermiculus sp.]